MENDRNNYKKHTTRRVVLRADFLALDDDLFKQIKNKIRINFVDEQNIFDTCRNAVFKKYELGRTDFNPSELKDSRIYLNASEESSEKVFECIKYVNGTLAYRLAVCNSNCSFEIVQDSEYKKFEDYRDIIKSVLIIIKDVSGDNFSLTRIGERKMNDVIFDESANLENYVKNDLFGFKLPLEDDKKVEFSERKYVAKEEESINVNFFTTFLTGRTKTQQIQRIAFDIDVYSTERKFLRGIEDKLSNSERWLEDLNTIIFKYFTLGLQNSFKEMLQTDSAITDEHIIAGVLNNG